MNPHTERVISMHSLLRRLPELDTNLRRDAVGSFVIKVMSAGLTTIIAALLGRLLGAGGYGNYAYALSWLVLLSMAAALGLDVFSIREIAQAIANKQWNVARGFLTWTVRMVLLAAIFLGILSAVTIFLFQGYLSPSIVKVLWVAVPVLPFLALLRLYFGAMQGLDRIIPAQIPQLVVLPIVFISVVGLLQIAHHLNAQWTMGAYGLSTLFAFGLAWYLLVKAIDWPQDGSASFYPRRWLLSSMFFLISGFATIFNNQIGVLMLGTLNRSDAAGIYDIAARGSVLVSFVLMAVNTALGPIVADLYVKGKREELQRIATKAARISLLGAIPVAVVLIFVGPYLLGWIGKEFARGAVPLTILTVGQMINVGVGSVGLILNMTGYEYDVAVGVVIALLVNLTLCLLLIPQLEIIGAAIAAAVSMTIWNVMLLVRVFKRLNINPTSFYFLR